MPAGIISVLGFALGVPCDSCPQFVEIPQVIEAAMEAHKADFMAKPSIEDIVSVSFAVR